MDLRRQSRTGCHLRHQHWRFPHSWRSVQGRLSRSAVRHAVAQLEAGGVPAAQARLAAPPEAAAFADWTVDDDSFKVTFNGDRRAVTVSFPLASLMPILKRSSPLHS